MSGADAFDVIDDVKTGPYTIIDTSSVGVNNDLFVGSSEIGETPIIYSHVGVLNAGRQIAEMEFRAYQANDGELKQQAVRMKQTFIQDETAQKLIKDVQDRLHKDHSTIEQDLVSQKTSWVDALNMLHISSLKLDSNV